MASIRITHKLAAQVRPRDVPRERVEAYLQGRDDCFEVTREDADGPNRVYIDLDLKAVAADVFEAKDSAVGAAMETCLRPLSTRMAIMTASSAAMGKVSWRATMPEYVGTRAAIKHFVETVVQPALGEWGAHVDTSVYTKGRKMRMLGSSKDGENRPLRLVAGTALDTLITATDGFEAPLDAPPAKSRKAAAPKCRARATGDGDPAPHGATAGAPRDRPLPDELASMRPAPPSTRSGCRWASC